MILKILPRHTLSIESLLRYIQNEGKGIDGKPHVILHNIQSKDIKGQVAEFLLNEAYRSGPIKKGTVFFRHEIISFSNKDQHLSAVILEDIAKEYIKIRGITGIYVGAIHGDREHSHIHFATGLQFKTGKSFHPKRPELQRIKTELQNYHREKYKDITANSICDHDADRSISDREYQLQKRTNKRLQKDELTSLVKSCFDQAKTQQQFFELLQDQNIFTYERSAGNIQGVMYKTKKYRFSRLEINLNSLSIDRSEENRIRTELSALRNKVQSQSRELER